MDSIVGSLLLQKPIIKCKDLIKNCKFEDLVIIKWQTSPRDIS